MLSGSSTKYLNPDDANIPTRRAESAEDAVADAIAEVRSEYEALVGPAVQRKQAAAIEQVQQQPGRGDPTPPATPPRTRDERGRFGAEGSLEQQLADLRAGYRR